MIKNILNTLIVTLISAISVFAQNVEQENYFKALYLLQKNKSDSALLILSTQKASYHSQKLMAEIYFNKKNFLKSAEIYKEIADSIPSEAYFKLAIIYAELEQAKESVSYLEKHFRYENPKPYSTIMSCPEFEKINSSLEWKNFWKKDRYNSIEIKLEEANYLYKSNELIEALSLLEDLEESISNERLNYLLSCVYYDYGNSRKALKYLDIKSGIKDPKSLILKRTIEIDMNMLSDAIITNKKLLEYDKFNPSHILTHSELLHKRNKTKEAQEYLNKYIKFFPDNEDAIFLKSRILIDDKKYSEALSNLDILIEVNPSKTEYFITRAETYYALEKWKVASNDYSMALDINPRLPEVWYYHGMCQFNLGNQKNACYSWKKAANLNSKEAMEMLFNFCNNKD